MNRYEKLTADLREAHEEANRFSIGENDEGTANLDATFLELKGWNESKTIQAIKNAGLYCRSKTKWIGEGYMLSVGCGQGNRRTVARNRFLHVLRSKGYSVLAFNKMD